MSAVHDRIRAHMIALGHPDAANLTDEQIEQGCTSMAQAISRSGVTMAQATAALSQAVTAGRARP